MQLLKLFIPIFKSRSPKVQEDLAIYKVITPTDTYCGQIIYQDDVMMWLKVTGKHVKVLKENIVKITII